MGQFQSRRLEFDAILREILGNNNTYFQPTNDVHMKYPCIVYNLTDASKLAANNGTYNWRPSYDVTHISYDPDSEAKMDLALLPLSSFSRHFATSGLNHDVFVIYY